MILPFSPWSDPLAWRKTRITVLFLLILLWLVVGYFVTSFALVFNVSHSLPHNGYAMVTYPKFITKGAYVAFSAPKQLGRDTPFIKEVWGMPGDKVLSNDNLVCVGKRCFELVGKSTLFLEATPSGVIPKDHYYLAGQSADSLDSRYAIVGLVHKDRIKAVGAAIPWFPNWEKLKERWQ